MSTTEIRFLGELNPDSQLGSRWERLVKDNPCSGIMQSLHWARMKRLQRMETMHLGVFEDDELVAGGIFYTGKKLNGTGIMVAPEGPVLPWNDASVRTRSAARVAFAIPSGISRRFSAMPESSPAARSL